ncbi:hypothetical protein C8R48DRAFT_671103 [Suillus tomentosus]|nr:hypothetical protein C8R48DRAFT_671103 [Suillus tomentosus]
MALLPKSLSLTPTCSCLQPFHARAIFATDIALLMCRRAPSYIFKMSCTSLLLHALSCEGNLCHGHHTAHVSQGAIIHFQDVLYWSSVACCSQPFHVRAIYATDIALLMCRRAPSYIIKMSCTGLLLRVSDLSTFACPSR